MNRNQFDFVCMESDAGRDAVVIRNQEHGLVVHCSGDHLLVKTPEGAPRCWDYRECEELTRGPAEFPWR